MAGQKLRIPVHVYVPITTKPMMIDKIRQTGAIVYIIGNNWNEADFEARKELELIHNTKYIPPFDHPLIWDGNSTIIDEIASQIDFIPDDIILSVGGGMYFT